VCVLRGVFACYKVMAFAATMTSASHFAIYYFMVNDTEKNKKAKWVRSSPPPKIAKTSAGDSVGAAGDKDTSTREELRINGCW